MELISSAVNVATPQMETDEQMLAIRTNELDPDVARNVIAESSNEILEGEQSDNSETKTDPDSNDLVDKFVTLVF